MIVIQKPRNKGKTTILLHYMVVDPLAIYVAKTERCAIQVFQLSKELELGLNKSRFIGITDNSNLERHHIHGYRILIDDADIITKQCPAISYAAISYAHAITITDN